ncbi:hypothetical protein [Streptomyces beigongshangae]|uniref:hypothetical protein n=1 Tax=Streptomyces beigongshangae TaxID=2841597 RepID=UPI001C84BABC|nr:hypothetical protein [Streptomyces sp. REN17]
MSRDLPAPATTRSFRDVQPDDLVSWLDEVAKLRRRNRELTSALALAATQIQYVTLENTRFREALEAQQSATRLR